MPVLTPSEPDGDLDELTSVVGSHIRRTVEALTSLEAQEAQLAAWGRVLAERLAAGHRLLVCGNGGSAAEAQHLTAEIVGRFDGERPPFSAIALHAETSALTAVANDYGYDEVFSRQVRAHGRPGDVLVVLSTSGRSPNLLRAVRAARELGITTWALTGPGTNPLAAASDEAICIAGTPASAQECHLVAVHAICRAFDATIATMFASPDDVGDEA
ncbi:MAG TPA: SIS domain-containing protein [Propionibacteriaceae bacterium]|nr:SIS domain-containing protein [Propionibacteriaceae bacterium]